MTRLRAAVEALLAEGETCDHPKVRAMCREILTLAPAMWTFVRVEGVEPTNNSAERALRPAVQARKNSFGTHGAGGSRFLERILTVTATLKQQDRNVVDYITEACERSISGRRPRSILPGGAIMTHRELLAAKTALPA